jgi:hypothetical protein
MNDTTLKIVGTEPDRIRVIDAGRIKVCVTETENIMKVIRTIDGEVLTSDHHDFNDVPGFIEKADMYSQICNHK